jgi:hypothetical protein
MDSTKNLWTDKNCQACSAKQMQNSFQYLTKCCIQHTYPQYEGKEYPGSTGAENITSTLLIACPIPLQIVKMEKISRIQPFHLQVQQASEFWQQNFVSFTCHHLVITCCKT